MFEVWQDNRIAITQGDTGALDYVPQSDHVFGENDYAVFSVQKKNGETLVRITLKPEASGRVRIGFDHEMTKAWPDGRHEWQLRYYLDATVSGETVTGGNKVSTPMEIGVLEVLRAV